MNDGSIGAATEHFHERYKIAKRRLPLLGSVVSPDFPKNSEAAAIETRRRLDALHAAHIRIARTDFGAFMEYAFSDDTGRGFAQQWFHDEWAFGMDWYDRLLIVAPRDHGKTSQVVGRTIWELGRNPDLRIKIVCASDGKAKERLFEVIQHIEQNPRVREVFPELEPSEHGEWSKHKIIVRRNALHRDASLEALGITSTATGGRADLLIADDVVDRRNALEMQSMRETIKNAWKSDWTNLLEPGGARIWYICTLWHKDDLSHMLMDNPAYKVLFYAVDEQFGALWPDKWSTEELLKRYREINDSVEFNRAFRNQAVDLDSAMVRSSWLKYARLAQTPEFLSASERLLYLNIYDTADAPSGSKAQDYTSGCTLAVDCELRRVYVIDSWHDRLTTADQAEKVYQEWKHYSSFRVLIEKAGLGTLAEWVLEAHPEMKGVIEVVRPQLSKSLRLLGVTPMLQNDGQVIFSHHLNPDDEAWSPGRGSLPGELVDFPFGKHDDMVDAFVHGLKYAHELIAQYQAAKEQDKAPKKKYRI